MQSTFVARFHSPSRTSVGVQCMKIDLPNIQCAAVITKLRVMSVAAQCHPMRPVDGCTYLMIAIHGSSPSSALTPPTIRDWYWTVPHSSRFGHWYDGCGRWFTARLGCIWLLNPSSIGAAGNSMQQTSGCRLWWPHWFHFDKSSTCCWRVTACWKSLRNIWGQLEMYEHVPATPLAARHRSWSFDDTNKILMATMSRILVKCFIFTRRYDTDGLPGRSVGLCCNGDGFNDGTSHKQRNTLI